jgi:hypothetical protein
LSLWWRPVSVGKPVKLRLEPTLVCWKAIQINLDGEVIALLRLHYEWTILSLQYFLSAVLDELAEALE